MSAVAPEATPRGETQSEDRAVLSPDGPVPPRPGAWEDAEVTHRKENALCGSLPGSGRAGLRFTVKVTADPGASVNDASARVRGAGPPLRTQTSPGGSHIPAGAQAGTSHAACDASRAASSRGLGPSGPCPCHLPGGDDDNRLPAEDCERTNARQGRPGSAGQVLVTVRL